MTCSREPHRGIEGGERALYIHSPHRQSLPDQDSNSQPFRLRLSTFRPRLTPGVTGVNLVQLENKQLKIEHFYFAIAWQYGKIIKF